MDLDPVAVALKFGFLAVLYLFLLWVARSALRDLRRTGGEAAAPDYQEATGMHPAGAALNDQPVGGLPRLRVETAAGLRAGAAYDVSGGAVLGRSADADIILGDSFSSGRHARLAPHGDAVVLEDLGSTNGTYLNGRQIKSAELLKGGHVIRIGDSEYRYQE